MHPDEFQFPVDDEAVASLFKELCEQDAHRLAFIAGPQCAAIRSAIANNPAPVVLDREHFFEFTEQAKQAAGVSFASDAEVALFIDVVSNQRAATVSPGRHELDSPLAFDTCWFRNFGLNVHLTIGLVNAVRILNNAAVLNEKPPMPTTEKPTTTATTSEPVYSQDDFEELRRLALASTKGPWTFINHNNPPEASQPSDDWTIKNPEGLVVCTEPQCQYKDLPTVCDGPYIAKAHPAMVLALMAELDRLRALVESQRSNA